MNIFIILWCIALQLAACGAAHETCNHMATSDFKFVSGRDTLSGIIDQPTVGGTRAVMLFIHGSGRTDIRANDTYIDLRSRFAGLGIACVLWDKPGCGRSGGQYDANQLAADRAQEVLDALDYLAANHMAGLDTVIIWSGSQGSRVAPLVLSERPDINHWISVSGLADIDNKYYLLKSNLPLEGYSAEETGLLMAEWIRGKRIFMKGGSYDAYLEATANLRASASVLYFAGDLTGTREAYEQEQRTYLSSKDRYTFDAETMGLVHVPHFDTLLSGLDIHVLALFGEKDTNLNWRRTKALYESTIGKNLDPTLLVRTFPDANHLISLTETGSVREVEGQLIRGGTKANGYYDIQLDWLRRQLAR